MIELTPPRPTEVPQRRATMSPHAPNPKRDSALSPRRLAPGLALAGVAWLAACSGSSSDTSAPTGPGGLDVSELEFVITDVDPHQGGRAQRVNVSVTYYGRLVEVFGLSGPFTPGAPLPPRVPMSSSFVVEPNLTSIGGQYIVDTNAVTGKDQLVILRNVNDTTAGGGREQFLELLRAASDNLPALRVADINTVGIFTMVPRNAAVVVVFDDLIDPRTIDNTTVRVLSGYPPTNPFEARIVPDVHYGAFANLDGLPGDEFYPTRVIIDPTVSEIEAFAVSPPLPINSTGFPFSIDVNRANLRLQFPTVRNLAAGQARVLMNPTFHPLSTSGNGPVDFADPGQPVLRAFRGGGNPDFTSDPSNGFLSDSVGPRVIGSNPITIVTAPVQVDDDIFVLPQVRFASTLCAQTPEVGDVISQNGVFAEVIQDAQVPTAGDLATDVRVRLVQFPPAWTGPEEWVTFGFGGAAYESAYDPADDGARQACFVRVLPRPTSYPQLPTTGLEPASSVSIRFSEPMDPRSLTAFDSLTLTRTPAPTNGVFSAEQFVIGRVGQTVDLREFTFNPDLPLNHVLGESEPYYLNIASGQFAPRDLAGNVVSQFSEVEFRIEPTAAAVLNGGRVSRFTAIDEEAPIAGSGEQLLPEWGGQLLVDTGRQLIRPRPVTRQTVILDRTKPTLQGHTPFSNGIVTPLSNFGSKMQTLWRYADCAFSINDPTNLNLDVEGLGWAPAGGAVVADAFDEFEIRLSHSRWAPDELIDPGSLFPQYPNSGLVNNFTNNLLLNEAQTVVHPRERGYIVNPADLFVAPSGMRVMPFPLNRGLPPEERRTFTWRDSRIRSRAGAQNGGVDPTYYLIALGLTPPTAPNKFYPPNEAQTAGLPLLLEFRTYRDDSALGINGFDINLAANSSSKPYFRAFTTGGVRQNGQPKYVDPDTETLANGGFNPGSTIPGAVTFGLDNSVYLGALDLVVRISHVHSVWFRSAIVGEPAFGGRSYLPPTLEPRAEDQPIGTSVEVSFRGATAITYLNPGQIPGAGTAQDNDRGPDDNPIDPASTTGQRFTDYQINGFTIDQWGDYYNSVDPPFDVHRTANANPGLTFLAGDSTWKTDVAQIEDAVFYQVRLTFFANIATGESPEVSAFALSWTQ